MAEKLTVTPFPKDMKAVLEHLVEYSKHKNMETAIRTCGILYVLHNPLKHGGCPMRMLRFSGPIVSKIADIIEDPNEALLLMKYEDDHDDTEEDGEVSEP